MHIESSSKLKCISKGAFTGTAIKEITLPGKGGDTLLDGGAFPPGCVIKYAESLDNNEPQNRESNDNDNTSDTENSALSDNSHKSSENTKQQTEIVDTENKDKESRERGA